MIAPSNYKRRYSVGGRPQSQCFSLAGVEGWTSQDDAGRPEGGAGQSGAGVATGLLCLGLQSGPGAETLDMMIASLVLDVLICLQGRSEGRVTVREPVLNF